MLIQCTGCNSKIRVPDSAAGKRVKCPKCATIVRAPEAKPEEAAAEPEETGVSTTPLPPAPQAEPEPTEETAEPETEVTPSRPSSSRAKPPPIKPTRARGIDTDDDDEDEEDEERQPPKRKRRRDDDDDDDDRDSRRRRRRRRDDDDDDDDDDLDVRRRRRSSRGRSRGEPVNGMAMASMIIGIVSVVFSVFGVCCCWIVFEPLAVLGGLMAIIFGFMGKTPGSEGYALTGIICGGLTMAIAVVIMILMFLYFGVNLAMLGQGGPRRF